MAEKVKGAKDKKIVVQKNWYYFWNIVAVGTPMLFNLLTQIFGVSLGLQEEINGKTVFTKLGAGVQIAVTAIAFIALVLYNAYSAKKGNTINQKERDALIENKDILEAKNQLLSKVQLSTNKIYISKYDTLLKEIRRLENNPRAYPNTIISDPIKQLKATVEHLVTCVSEISDLEESQLFVRVAYQLKGAEWHWLDGYSSEGFFNLDNLINTPSTTFNCITRKDSHRENFIFFNRKSLAVANRKYVYEPYKDIDGDVVDENTIVTDGSILAKSVFIGDTVQDAFAEIAIFIYTTDDRLIIKNDSRESIKAAKQLLKNSVFGAYESQFKVELALLYLHHLKDSRRRTYTVVR